MWLLCGVARETPRPIHHAIIGSIEGMEGKIEWANLYGVAVMHYIQAARNCENTRMSNSGGPKSAGMEDSVQWLVDHAQISELLFSFATAITRSPAPTFRQCMSRVSPPTIGRWGLV
jgi:hypothetical protein